MDMESFDYRLLGPAEEGERLAPLDWGGLLARLGAERDLRRELAGRNGTSTGAASFVAGAAWALDRSPQGQRDVNRDALADCKAARGIMSATGTEAPAAGSDARGQK